MAPTSLDSGLLTPSGEPLCLALANTAEWHAAPHPTENLNTYADLVNWGVKAGAIDQEDGSQLLIRAGRSPGRAEAVLGDAVSLREAIYRIFSATAKGAVVENSDLEIVNRILARALPRQRLVASGPGFTWRWEGDDQFDRVLWPVARSAAELLTSPLMERVGECADDRGCGWLFLDTSRNHSRRWCGMDSCGNRAKARRHYLRTRPTPA